MEYYSKLTGPASLKKGWRAKYYPKGGIDMALSPKQMKALELLTCGKGLTYKVIAEETGVMVRILPSFKRN